MSSIRPTPPLGVAAADLPGFNRESSRVAEYDVVRGLAIFGVVFIHGSGLLAPGPDPLHSADAFRWCVPMFIALTALLAARSVDRAASGSQNSSQFRMTLKRFGRLFVPYAAWTAVYMLIFSGREITPRSLLTHYLSGYLWSGQYYFVIVLQLVWVLPALARRRVSGGWAIAGVAAGAGLFTLLQLASGAVPLINQLRNRPFPYWLPIVLVGVWAARSTGLQHWPTSLLVAATAACVLVVWAEPMAWAAAGEPAWDAYLLPATAVASAAVFVLLLRLSERLDMGPAGSVLGVVGRYSLGVFCANPLIIWVLGRIGAGHWTDGAALPLVVDLPARLVSASVIVALCVGLSAALARTPVRALVR